MCVCALIRSSLVDRTVGSRKLPVTRICPRLSAPTRRFLILNGRGDLKPCASDVWASREVIFSPGWTSSRFPRLVRAPLASFPKMAYHQDPDRKNHLTEEIILSDVNVGPGGLSFEEGKSVRSFSVPLRPPYGASIFS